MDLADIIEFRKVSDALPHDWDLAGAIVNFLDGDGLRQPGVDVASIILNGDELPFIVENAPIFLNKTIDLVADRRQEMGQVELLAALGAMDRFVIRSEKLGGDVTEGWGRVLTLAKDGTAVDIPQDDIKVVRLIRKSPVVVKYIFTFLPAHAGCDPLMGSDDLVSAVNTGGGSKLGGTDGTRLVHRINAD